MSYNTMKHMVISAVKGTPATSESCKEHLKTFKRSRTPFPSHSSGTDSEGSTTPATHDPFTEEVSAGDETGDSMFHEESDSAGEMALIEQNFTRPITSSQVGQDRSLEEPFSTRENPEASDTSCQDGTFSQVREHAIAEKTFSSSSGKQARKKQESEEARKSNERRIFFKIWVDPVFHRDRQTHCIIQIWFGSISVKVTVLPKDQRRHCVITGPRNHLRKDQHWRYEYLKSVDLVTKRVQHRVRGRDGRMLIELE